MCEIFSFVLWLQFSMISSECLPNDIIYILYATNFSIWNGSIIDLAPKVFIFFPHPPPPPPPYHPLSIYIFTSNTNTNNVKRAYSVNVQLLLDFCIQQQSDSLYTDFNQIFGGKVFHNLSIATLAIHIIEIMRAFRDILPHFTFAMLRKCACDLKMFIKIIAIVESYHKFHLRTQCKWYRL